jgi:hypothetical protein
MVALRGARAREAQPERDLPKPDPADWLPLQQAACELNVSVSTARRMIRRGLLRNRIVPRRGGFAYLIYLPGSRHAGGLHDPEVCAPATERMPVPIHQEREPWIPDTRDLEIRRLEEQIEHLSDALSRALKIKQRSLPAGIGEPALNAHDPYARYRWLVRRKKWWPFS